MAPIIETQQLTLRFGKKTVLSGLDLSLEEGVAVTLAGRNGAGKSTLLRCLAGVLLPDGGRVVRATGLTAHALGYVSEKSSLFEDHSLHAARALHGQVYGISSWDDAFLAPLNLDWHTPVRSLSAGERILFHLHLVLAQNPRLLLLDEVMAFMDPYAREILIEALIERLASGQLTLVSVNHTFSDIERIPERVLVMEQGRFITDVPADDLRQTMKRWTGTTPPPSELPVVFSHHDDYFNDCYLYPCTPAQMAKWGGQLQDITLGDAVRALIGGAYAAKRMA